MNTIIVIMDNKSGTLHSKLALKIKLERTKKNMSQEDLALGAGLNKNTIGKIERAETSPTIETLDKIASALGLEMLDLIDFSRFDI